MLCSSLRGVAAEFLAQPDGHGVLQMGAADLDDVRELLRLLEQRHVQLVQCRDQFVRDTVKRCDVDGGGDDVVARLAAVDVIVRVDATCRRAGRRGFRWRDSR